MPKTKTTPELRFAGYSDPWEQRKVGTFASVLSASRVHKDEWRTEGVPFYRSSDVVSAFKGNDNERAFISTELYEELIKSSGRLEKGDILITGGGSIGIPYIVPNNEPLYSKDADLIWIKKSAEHDSQYLYAYFTSQGFREYISSISHVGTIAHYTIEQVKDTPVLLPSVAEQSAIGLFFSQLDTLITLHQRKYERLKTVKASMLEKMFPRNGSNLPEIRFSGFTDPWEQRKLGEVGKARSGVGFPDTEQGGTSGTPFFKVSDMNNDGNENEMNAANNYVTDAQIAARRWSPIEEVPAIFFAKVGAAVMLNRKRLCRFPFLLDNNTMAYSLGKNQWDADFAKALFETVDLTSLVQVGALPSYNAGDVEEMKIMLPEISEQCQIGAYFRQLDTLITLHQRKLEKLKQLKQSFLAKMFV